MAKLDGWHRDGPRSLLYRRGVWVAVVYPAQGGWYWHRFVLATVMGQWLPRLRRGLGLRASRPRRRSTRMAPLYRRSAARIADSESQ